jgi:hypothetical protein
MHCLQPPLKGPQDRATCACRRPSRVAPFADAPPVVLVKTTSVAASQKEREVTVRPLFPGSIRGRLFHSCFPARAWSSNARHSRWQLRDSVLLSLSTLARRRDHLRKIWPSTAIFEAAAAADECDQGQSTAPNASHLRHLFENFLERRAV